MPPLAAMVAAGVLFSLYGNQPLDPHWSAYAPLLLMLAYFDPGRRLLLVAVAAALWSDAFFSYQLQQRLAPADDNRLARVVVEIVDLPRVGNGRIGLEVEVLSLRPAVQRRGRR